MNRGRKTLYLVKDLARETGYSVYTVEHYLKEGLVREMARSPYTQYRFFDERAVKQLQQIRKLRKAGKTLDEIRPLVKRNGK